jgi:hypothetical protein
LIVEMASTAPPGILRPPSSVAGWPIADTRYGCCRTVPSTLIRPSRSAKAVATPMRTSLTASASAPASRSSWTTSMSVS